MGICDINNVRVISRKTLKDFWEKHTDSKEQLQAWYAEAVKAQWTPAVIKRAYPSTSFLHGNRIVFNIKGNKYRLIVKINFETKIVYIRFVGSHSEYDKIYAEEI